ncbi:MAG: hypothetical protein PHX82_15615 [Paracoccaceae bacterium]|nr:hypothetical protein [Paracoccaceae bacterium]
MTVTREILWKSSIATESEVLQMEFYLIVQTRANDPAIGCDRRPVFRGPSD